MKLPISIIALCFFLLNTCSIDDSYRNHYSERITLIEWTQADFSLSKVEERTISLLVTPNTDTLDEIIQRIDEAKKRIWIEVYSMTEKRIREAIIRAKKRWIDTKVILEENVFWFPKMNRESFGILEKNWIEVSYASNHLYNFTHAKFYIIDDTYIISTWNIAHTTFTKNREFFAKWNNQSDLIQLEKIFIYDSKKEKLLTSSWYNLIISPINSRTNLVKIIQQAEKNIVIYIQSLSDDIMIENLEKSANNGIQIKICLAEKNEKSDINEVKEKLWKYSNVHISTSKKPYIHAKIVLIDNKYIFLWSTNFTENAIIHNREVWIVWKEPENGKNIQIIQEKYTSDCE